ncbi:MAG: beta-galactosidase, partial [Muribaculaceae bacterium]|nr:beta-galactosidase [Muribaculaceae bacterium]
MKLQIITAAFAALAIMPAQSQYAPAGNRIQSEWATTVTPDNVWKEYPRPLMQRNAWQNLNGLWNYAIVPVGSEAPANYDGEILVPFCVESSLSGVGRTVGQDNELWYNRTFTIPATWGDQDIRLNFGAVDWKCDVWVNDQLVGGHTGGYTPFSLDITDAVRRDSANTLTIRVFDPTDKGYQARGKQNQRPHGIWYTPVTGIWQTVWMEPVNRVHIANLNTVADIDRNTLDLTIDPSTDDGGLSALIEVADNGTVIHRTTVPLNGHPVSIDMGQSPKLWSPDSPFLYDVTVTLMKNDEPVDRVESYAAMRKISTARDADGIVRMQLNNKDMFQFGPLDQGWWPDGLYTAPSYEAMIYDIDKTKDLGFNMIRKHVKVEPALWYAY